jgi:hypothetical protein
MRIVDIRETAIPLKSKLANSSFDFSEMTTSVVAVITDVMRGGKPVCGFAFNSPAAMPAARKCARASSRASSPRRPKRFSTPPAPISTRRRSLP